MIRKLTLSNFRSLGPNVVVRLGRLNFLVGVNGSGKSNVLHALTFVSEAVRIGLPGAVTNNGGIVAVRRHSTGHPYNMMIELEIALERGSARYGFEITGDRSEEYRVRREWAQVSVANEFTEFRVEDGNWSGPGNLRPAMDKQSLAITALGGDFRIKPLWEFLANRMVYSIYPDVLRNPQKFSSETPMKSRGENWASLLYQQDKKAWKADLVAALGKLTGDIEGIRVTRAAGLLVAQICRKTPGEKSKKWFDAASESDGTLRVAGLLTALLQEPSLPVIGIEEPELTVHPGALPLLFDYLDEASHRSQILVTTHSPLLLDYLDLDKANVFVVRRREAITAVGPLSEQHKESVKKQLLTLGDLMISGELQLSMFEDKAV